MSLSVAVTGGTGFLGRRRVRTLVEQDLTVRCFVRPSSDVEALLAAIPDDRQRQVEIVRGELTDRPFLDRHLREIDVLYHLAAALHGDATSMWERTVLPTRSLIDAALANEVGRFVLVSSIGVYASRGESRSVDDGAIPQGSTSSAAHCALCRTGQTPAGSVIDESTPIERHPERRDPYTRSKLEQERLAWESVLRDRLPLVVVRPGVIYGPGRSLVTSRVGLKIGPVLLRAAGNHSLPYIDVDNCADGVMRAGILAGTDHEIFNLVDDELPTGRMILDRLRQAGHPVRSLSLPRSGIELLAAFGELCCGWIGRADSPFLTRDQVAALWKPMYYCNAKAKHRLNWKPKISLEEGLQRTIEVRPEKTHDRLSLTEQPAWSRSSADSPCAAGLLGTQPGQCAVQERVLHRTFRRNGP